MRREGEENLAPIQAIAGAPDQAVPFKPEAQFNGGVVFDLQPFGQHPDGRLQILRQPSNRQQGLVLLGLDARRSRRFLADIQIAANLIPKRTRKLILCSPELMPPIISYCDILREPEMTRAKRQNKRGGQ
jgi:hypothetical protein